MANARELKERMASIQETKKNYKCHVPDFIL